MKSTDNEQDDFQFRPLTKGLGFHSRTQAQPAPAPRPTSRETDLGNTQRVEEIFKTLNDKKQFNFTEKAPLTKHSLREPVEPTFQLAKWDASASLLDSMLITAASLLCMIILLMVTKVDLFANFFNPDSQGMIYLSLVAMVAGITWIYLVANRVFLGFTPGEWVFEQRLGKPEVLGTNTYALKAVARATVIVATGGILFPLLSLLFNRDLLGRLMGLELVKRS